MDIHTYFNLTYSNALILTRKQVGFDPKLAEMAGEVQRAYAQITRGYEFVALEGDEYLYEDLGEDQMRVLDIASNADTVHEDCDHEDVNNEALCEQENLHWYDWRGDEHSGHEYLTVPTETLDQARSAGRVVLHRTFLQSMRDEWQERFVDLLHKLEAAGHDGGESYEIRVFDERGNRTTDPVPHYRRGRTYIEPRLEVSA